MHDELVTLRNLQQRPSLNGRVGRCVAWMKERGRWRVDLDDEVVCIKPENISRDLIKLTWEEETLLLPLGLWQVASDATESACAFVGQTLKQRGVATKLPSNLTAVLCRDDVETPLPLPQVMTWSPSRPCYDQHALRSCVAEKLPSHRIHIVKEIPIGTKACMRFVAGVHNGDKADVYLMCRTPENGCMFGQMAVMTKSDLKLQVAIAAGVRIVAPAPDAIVFHKDNFVTFATDTLSVHAAARKVAQLVTESDSLESERCCVCQNDILRHGHCGAFLPCPSCRGNVHDECLQKLREQKVRKCPLCRGPLSRSE